MSTPGEMEGRLREALEEGGHRYTAQRAAAYRALHGTTSHPTADEIFLSVRDEIPDISLATVYKALEAFVSCGLARKLTYGEGPARYDHRTDAHDHVRCTSCGAVRDVENPSGKSRLQELQGGTDFEVVDYRLELLGLCPDCRS
jgi:Fe2+ or Zn2+ uptake regulation protein